MSSDEESKPAWYCLRSQTKREHIAAATLARLDEVEVFCPRIRYRKPTRRGVIWWVEPLFPGYLLARFEQTQSLRDVLHTQGVSGIVKFGSTIPALDAAFVESLREEFAAEADQAEMLTIERKLSPGDEVEMVDGAFKGLTGQILEVIPSKERVMVLLEFLGQERPIVVDPFSLVLREKDA
ncbi:MAG: transcription termination/antitermination NusG family protein [Verrucomicrobiota bacterium JB023]|nr:transcription termination/antitermination NusG family protein [Verrucomicrobiota bacterium JB023]